MQGLLGQCLNCNAGDDFEFDGNDYGVRPLKISDPFNPFANVDKGKGKSKRDKGDKGKGKGNSELQVFVGGLPLSVEEAAVRMDFEEFGEIESLRLPLNEEGNARGMAFIVYKSKDGVDKALALDGKEYRGQTLTVLIAGQGEGKGKDGKGWAKDGKGWAKDGKGKGRDGKAGEGEGGKGWAKDGKGKGREGKAGEGEGKGKKGKDKGKSKGKGKGAVECEGYE